MPAERDRVAALARELAAVAQQLGLIWTVAQVRERLADTKLIELGDELLLATHAQRLLLVVHQLEELLTQSSPDVRAQFATLLNSTLGSPVHVVATLRPEFLHQLLAHTILAPIHLYPLRPLHREGLREVIQGPAQVAGLTITEALVARLVGDTNSGKALPLLAFTLAQLAERVGHGGQLSAARYEQLGGVQSALTRQADAALAEASALTGASIRRDRLRRGRALTLTPNAEVRGSLLGIAVDPDVTRLIGHTSFILSVAFSPDGRALATGSDDATARLWDISDPRHPVQEGTSPATLAPSGRWLSALTGES